MNMFVLSALALCVAASGAAAQYQSAAPASYQRKMAPSPASYQAAGHYEPASTGYRQPAPAYEAPSAYAAPRPQYAAPKSYAKPAPAAHYEEPYYPPMPFAWGYDINDGYGGAQYHKENGDEYGKRTGSYGYTDAYGIYRQVDYVADEHGFRATIKTNEPGTANESPADVELHAYEPPSNYYAGSSYSAPASPQYAAPAKAAYAPAKSYAAPKSYSAPKPQYAKQAPQYEAGPQYSSSVIVPVYSKLAAKPSALAPAPAKRAY